MVKQNTVFVLGAGASRHYGYPSGEELRNNIIKYFVKWYTKHFGPRFSLGSWTTMTTFEKDRELKDVKKFIEDFNLSEEQIDLFISRNPDHAKLGMLAIVLGIYHAEQGELEIPEVSDSDSGEVSDTIPVNFRTLVLVS